MLTDHEIIVDLKYDPTGEFAGEMCYSSPVFATALLDFAKTTAVHPHTFHKTEYVPSDNPYYGGIRPMWYECTAVDIGPSTFYLDASVEEVRQLADTGI
ncbi:MAG: hypothetical protein V3T23_07540 [Nitrososphaerales archaeon]